MRQQGKEVITTAAHHKVPAENVQVTEIQGLFRWRAAPRCETAEQVQKGIVRQRLEEICRSAGTQHPVQLKSSFFQIGMVKNRFANDNVKRIVGIINLLGRQATEKDAVVQAIPFSVFFGNAHVFAG